MLEVLLEGDGEQDVLLEGFFLRLAPQDVAAGFQVEGPRGVGQDDGGCFESLRLVNGHDADGILSLRGGDGLLVARLAPPFQEGREVAALGVFELEDEVAESLQEGGILLLGGDGEECDKLLHHLVERAMGQFGMEGAFVFAEAEVAGECLVGGAAFKLEVVAPGNGTQDVRFGVLSMLHQADERLDRRTGRKQQGFARDDVHAIGAFGMLVLVAQQGLGSPAAFLVPAAEDGDVRRTEPLLLQIDDDLGQAARSFGHEVLDTRFGYGRPIVVGRFEEADANEPLWLTFAKVPGRDVLLHLLVDGADAARADQAVELFGEVFEEVVVEFHDGRQGAPVGDQRGVVVVVG